ncbi:MAG: hypothetical protein CMA64_05350 [Euryarchaeota archaeon]|nr:hypothetical protein [Euryarchaeota archaeon]|tara:strand:+ start:596 stop:973 length:378 start_codon:yes stop_codon:yes gene_type:complete
MKIKIEVSVGELFDKISILKLKTVKISDPEKLKNIKKELSYLEGKFVNTDPDVDKLSEELFVINAKLWDIENSKRKCEAENNFSWDFIQLARDVYIYNDKRAELKRKINDHTGSDVVEEKEYTRY